MDEPTTQAVFDFIGDYIQERGYAPNVREVAQACYISRSYVISVFSRPGGNGPDPA